MNERIKPPDLQSIQFMFDPNFNLSGLGEEVDTHPNEYVIEYIESVGKEWKELEPKVTLAIRSVLLIDYPLFLNSARVVCRVLKSRIIVSDHLYIEAYSHPISIWAIPPHAQWGYLPFHARLIHELVHQSKSSVWNGVWETEEDNVIREYKGPLDLFSPKNRALLEELTVRNFTHKITQELFGEEFANWFFARESSFQELATYFRLGTD